MTFVLLILACLAAGVGSVLVAGLLTKWFYQRHTQLMLSFAAGALLSTALMHLMPEAVQSDFDPQELFTCFMIGLVFFFVLDKAELWHHGHEHGTHSHLQTPLHAHHHPADGHHVHDHDAPKTASHSAPAATLKTGSWSVLLGDSVHVFGDGLLIAAAFAVDDRLGFLAALAVFVHEVPHHMGDLAVLRQTAGSEGKALLKVSLAGCFTVLGGVLGWFLLERFEAIKPLILAVSASSFVYVALADLIPQLQKHVGWRASLGQIISLVVGVVLVAWVSHLAH